MHLEQLDALIGNTPLLNIRRLPVGAGCRVLGKLEGQNPGGSVKDRAALAMIRRAAERGHIRPGDTLIEATSGNTGIALAMIAAIAGYKMRLIMPDNMSLERRAAMTAFGAELVLVTKEEGMEYARDLADDLGKRGEGLVLNQFANEDNPYAHFTTTGPEIWRDTHGEITHFVSSMGTTGTIMGVSRYLKSQHPNVQIVGVQPAEGSSIPGIRRWPAAYLPKIFNPTAVDRVMEVSQQEAEAMTRQMARQEGLCAGVSAGGAMAAALALSRECAERGEAAVIVTIVCDRGDRYLSTGVFNDGSH